MSEQTIDLTPAGCQTPEGIARVNAALRAVDEANAECARLLDEHAGDLAPMLRHLGAWDDVMAARARRDDANEEFLRALSHAPAASRKGEGER